MRKINCCGFFLFVCMYAGLCQKADLVLLNGKIITLKNTGDRVEAVAVIADKIFATGNNASMSQFIGRCTKSSEETITDPGFA